MNKEVFVLSRFWIYRFCVLTFCCITAVGCRAPWESSNRVPTIEVCSDSPSSLAGDTIENKIDYTVSRKAPSQEEAMATAVAGLQQLKDSDPIAHQELMNELKEVKPSLWPLLVRSRLSALAYGKQLAQREIAATTLASNNSSTSPIKVIANATDSPSIEKPIVRNISVREIGNQRNHIALTRRSDPFEEPVKPIVKRVSLDAKSMDNKEPYSTPTRPTHSQQLESLNPLRANPFSSPGSITPIPQPLGYQENKVFKHPNDTAFVETIKQASFSEEPKIPFRQQPTKSSETTLSRIHNSDNTFSSKELSNHPASKQAWNKTLNESIRKLEELTQNPPATNEEINLHSKLRMLYLVAGKTDKALQPIPGISPTQQDFWKSQLYGLDIYLDEKQQPDNLRRAAAAKAQLSEATALLGNLSTLSVKNLTFCSKVTGFGIYKKLEEKAFKPGQTVIVYLELDNYRSDSTEKGFHTALGTSYEVLNKQGQRVARGEFRDIEDHCNNRRRDFHIQYELKLPERLYPDEYQLKMILQDRLSNKIGQTNIRFNIADPNASKK